MKKLLNIDLTLFAEVQTTLLKTEGNDLSPEMKVYYEKQLLEDSKANLVHGQFGQKKKIPKGNGKSIEFRKFTQLPPATQPIAEGVTPDGNKLDVKAITAEVEQYGDYILMSDLLDLTAVDPVLVEASKVLGNQASLTLDTLTRDELHTGNNVMYAQKVVGDVKTDITSRKDLTDTARLTVDGVYRAAAALKRMNAPKINGYYVAIVHPDAAFDIVRDDEWVEAHKYASPEEIYEGEIGKIGGVRFVESSNAKIYKDNTCPDGLAVYGTLFFGADAYGDVELEGGGLEHIVKQKGSSGTADPLNQRSSAGWKASHTSIILHQERLLRFESTSAFSGISEAN